MASATGSPVGDVGPDGELHPLRRREAPLRQPDPDVALLRLILARQPQDDLPPETLEGRFVAVHPPPPGGIAGKGHHPAVAVVVGDQQRLVRSGVGQHDGPGRQVVELVGPFQRRQLRPQRRVLLPVAGQHQGEVHQPQRRGLHLQRARPVQVGAQRLVGLLPLEPVHAHRQHVGQRRLAVAAGPEALKAAEHHQARPAADALGQLGQLVALEGRRIDVAQDVDVVLARLEALGQVGRPALADRGDRSARSRP